MYKKSANCFHIMKNRANYTTEEKLAIVREVLSRKRSIQRIGEEKGIAPTLISLWKKQAEDAMSERFQPRPKGRRKIEKPEVETSPQLRSAKNEARKAKIKAAHLEASLKDAKARIAELEQQISSLVSTLGFKMVKKRKARKSAKG
jgi:transposase-like protein